MAVSKFRRLGFTLIEVVLVASIFSIIVSGIVLAINRSYVFLDNTRLSVRAANLAREGVEMMFSIRDTNWRKHSGDRNAYWLNLGEGTDLFGEGIYVLREKKVNETCSEDCNMYVYAQPLKRNSGECLNLLSARKDFYSSDGFWKDSYNDARVDAKLTFPGVYSYYDENGEEQEGSIEDALIGEGLEFYRIVRVFGIYKKNDESSGAGCDGDCLKNGTPAEMRFCVKVFYRSTGKHASELCGIMTNFME